MHISSYDSRRMRMRRRFFYRDSYDRFIAIPRNKIQLSPIATSIRRMRESNRYLLPILLVFQWIKSNLAENLRNVNYPTNITRPGQLSTHRAFQIDSSMSSVSFTHRMMSVYLFKMKMMCRRFHETGINNNDRIASNLTIIFAITDC